MKRNIIILSSAIIVILIVTVVIFELFSPVVQKVSFSISNETVYLKQISDISFEQSVISKANYTANRPDSLVEYVNMEGRYFFYKVKNDSLFIYGGSWSKASKKIIKNIKFFNNEDSLYIYRKDYFKRGLRVFPPSEEKFLK